MIGQKIVIEGRVVRYLVAGVEIAGEENERMVGFDSFEDAHLRRHPRLRRVLTTLIRNTPLFYGVLHWSDGKDLDELDRKVMIGDIVDADFNGALLAEPRDVTCRNCEETLRVLAVDPGQPLFAATLAGRLRAHRFESTCRRCGAELPLHIVEILEPA